MPELLRISQLKVGDVLCLASSTNDYFFNLTIKNKTPLLIPENICTAISYEEKLKKTIDVLSNRGPLSLGHVRRTFESIFNMEIPGISYSYLQLEYDIVISVKEITQKFTTRHFYWSIQCMNGPEMHIMPSISLPDNPRVIKL